MEKLCITFFLQKQSGAGTFASILVIQVYGLVRSDLFGPLAELGIRNIPCAQNMASFIILWFTDIDELRFPVPLDKFFLCQICDRFS